MIQVYVKALVLMLFVFVLSCSGGGGGSSDGSPGGTPPTGGGGDFFVATVILGNNAIDFNTVSVNTQIGLSNISINALDNLTGNFFRVTFNRPSEVPTELFIGYGAFNLPNGIIIL